MRRGRLAVAIVALSGACTIGGSSDDDGGGGEPRLVSFTVPAETVARVGQSYTFTSIQIANDGDEALPASVDLALGFGHPSRDGVYCYDISSLFPLPADCRRLAPGASCTIPSLAARILDPSGADCLSVPRGAGFYWAAKVDASNVVGFELVEDDNFRSSGSFAIQ